MIKRKDLKEYLISGAPVESVPCGFWMHFPEESFYGEASIKAHMDYYEKTGVPLVKMMNEHFYQLGVEVKEPADWRNVKERDLADTPYPAFLEELRQFRERMGEDALILATIHGVLVSACHATDGPGHFTDPDNMITRHMKEDPESAAIGLQGIAHTLEKLCLACIEAGADGIYYAALGGEEHRFSEEMFNRYVKPLEVELLETVAQKGVVVLHICKDSPRLPMYRDYPCHVVNWAEHDSRYSLKDGAALFPGKRIIGAFDNRSGAMLSGTNEEMRREMERAVAEVGRDRIVIGADCTLPGTTGTERIRAAVELCKGL